MLDGALMLAARGVPVFPLVPLGKGPLISRQQGGHGCHDATTNAAAIVAFLDRDPVPNIGIATGLASGLLGIDVDPRHGGHTTMQALVARYGRLPDTLRAESCSRGWHLYLRCPAEPIRTRAHALGAGVDIRAEGGYLVAPPSYVVVPPRDDAPGYQGPYRWIALVEPAECPAWIAALATPRAARVQRSTAHVRVPADVIDRARAFLRYQRERHPSIQGSNGSAPLIYTAIALVRGFVLDEQTALGLLTEWNVDARPPWSQRELVHAIENAGKSAKPVGFLLSEQRPWRRS
jgi:hypothetical protein